MVKNDFLDTIKTFTEEAIKELVLPVRVQSAGEQQTYRMADVYEMRLPDATKAQKKAPYIIHAIITSSDIQPSGGSVQSKVELRSIFCVYHDNEQEGAKALLELIERFRIQLLRTRVLDGRYALDLTTAAEYMIYPDDTAPYYAGEMTTTWKVPSVERDVSEWLQG